MAECVSATSNDVAPPRVCANLSLPGAGCMVGVPGVVLGAARGRSAVPRIEHLPRDLAACGGRCLGMSS